MPVDRLRLNAGLLIALTLVVPLLGCGSRPRVRAIPPAAFTTADFPNLPVPIGFVPSPVHDQLAVSLADGAVRRYAAVYEAADPKTEMDEVAILAWYNDRLPPLGWQAESHTQRTQVWLRQRADGQRERLRLAAGRADRRPIIRLLLTPEAAP